MNCLTVAASITLETICYEYKARSLRRGKIQLLYCMMSGMSALQGKREGHPDFHFTISLESSNSSSTNKQYTSQQKALYIPK